MATCAFGIADFVLVLSGHAGADTCASETVVQGTCERTARRALTPVQFSFSRSVLKPPGLNGEWIDAHIGLNGRLNLTASGTSRLKASS
jgi:hypothetical protein